MVIYFPGSICMGNVLEKTTNTERENQDEGLVANAFVPWKSLDDDLDAILGHMFDIYNCKFMKIRWGGRKKKINRRK